jgi:hypothetical protein
MGLGAAYPKASIGSASIPSDPRPMIRAMSSTRPVCSLGICDGGGFIIDEATNTARDCQCRAEQIRNRKFLTRRLGHVPTRYRDATLERPPFLLLPSNMQSPIREFHHKLSANLEEGHGLWIQGPLHSAKRTAAAAITRRATALGHSAQMHNLRRLMALSRECVDQDAALSPLQFADKLIELDLLTLAGPLFEPSSFALEQLSLVLDGRWDHRRSLVLVTEQTPDELAANFGAAGKWLISRIHGICGPPVFVELNSGHDRRAA